LTPKLIFAAIIFAIAVTPSSCKKSELDISGTDFLVFGQFYGFCQGESCIEIFKLGNGKVAEDSRDTYPSQADFYAGDFHDLPGAKFDAVKDLINFFPKELLDENNKVLGQPDAADQGGLYIEYNFNGKHKSWHIDQNKGAVPEKYHAFMDKVNEKIALLQ
jgi:hypothetical protein